MDLGTLDPPAGRLPAGKSYLRQGLRVLVATTAVLGLAMLVGCATDTDLADHGAPAAADDGPVAKGAIQTPLLDCRPYTEMVKELSRRFGEHAVGFGLDYRGVVVEAFMSEDGASWSFIVTTPRRNSCIIAHGKDWVELQPPDDGRDH